VKYRRGIPKIHTREGLHHNIINHAQRITTMIDDMIFSVRLKN